MSGNQFLTATSILFVGYILLQLPSTVVLTKLKPSIALPSAMMAWGLVSLLTAWVQNYSGLLAVRFMLGIVEGAPSRLRGRCPLPTCAVSDLRLETSRLAAPFFPGAMFVLSCWYTRAELGKRYAFFYAGAALANMFNGLLSAIVLRNLNGTMGYAGWRWLYIIEVRSSRRCTKLRLASDILYLLYRTHQGALTMFIALFGYWLLPNYPISTKWLSEEQRHFAAWRLAVDMGSDDSDEDMSLMQSVKLAVKDPKLYLFMLTQHLILLSQSFQYVFPSVVKTLGYSSTITSLLTAPPWFAAFLAGLATTWSASRTQQRGYYIVGTMLLSAVGNMMVTFGTSLGVRYTGMIFLCMGVLSAFQISLTWVSNSFARPTGKRAACIAIVNLFGNAANTYGSQLYPSKTGPQYRLVSRATGCTL
jgi:MFS family permease